MRGVFVGFLLKRVAVVKGRGVMGLGTRLVLGLAVQCVYLWKTRCNLRRDVWRVDELPTRAKILGFQTLMGRGC